MTGGKIYHYRIWAIDRSGNLSHTDDLEYHYRGAEISNIKAYYWGDATIVEWDTDIPTRGVVETAVTSSNDTPSVYEGKWACDVNAEGGFSDCVFAEPQTHHKVAIPEPCLGGYVWENGEYRYNPSVFCHYRINAFLEPNFPNNDPYKVTTADRVFGSVFLHDIYYDHWSFNGYNVTITDDLYVHFQTRWPVEGTFKVDRGGPVPFNCHLQANIRSTGWSLNADPGIWYDYVVDNLEPCSKFDEYWDQYYPVTFTLDIFNPVHPEDKLHVSWQRTWKEGRLGQTNYYDLHWRVMFDADSGTIVSSSGNSGNTSGSSFLSIAQDSNAATINYQTEKIQQLEKVKEHQGIKEVTIEYGTQAGQYKHSQSAAKPNPTTYQFKLPNLKSRTYHFRLVVNFNDGTKEYLTDQSFKHGNRLVRFFNDHFGNSWEWIKTKVKGLDKIF